MPDGIHAVCIPAGGDTGSFDSGYPPEELWACTDPIVTVKL
uniref:Uncharacterized protein n=1 Tax=Faecalibaculum rodentium TaxID=1702221 RepID=A0A140DXG9_9FIRM|nr:hypothetical protein AALO17_22120 [Faecalibaculum rodentium]